jgi:nicotinamide-nucleotide amidase
MNLSWLCGALNDISIKLIQATIVKEEKITLVNALSAAQARADILIIGGIAEQGNLLNQALKLYFNSSLVDSYSTKPDHNPISPAINFIDNPLDTAPGIWCEHNNKVWITLSGKYNEMQQMMQDTVVPRLQARFQLPAIYHQTIHIVEIDETKLATMLKPWIATLPSYIKLACLPRLGIISLKLTASGKPINQLKQALKEQITYIQSLIAPYIYGYNEDTLETVIAELLKAQGKSIAIAESCSGGYASHLITRVAGSSAYYKGGMIPYHTEAKIALLGVQATTVSQYSAVSKETAIEMAQQVRTKFSTDIGLATTGIAGPTGGSKEKPVGTIWIALADEHTTYTEQLQLGNDRLENIHLTAIYLLNLLRKVLQGIK